MRPSPAPATNLDVDDRPARRGGGQAPEEGEAKQQAVELAAALNAAGGPAPETSAFREVLAAHGADSAAPSDSQ